MLGIIEYKNVQREWCSLQLISKLKVVPSVLKDVMSSATRKAEDVDRN